MSSFLRAAAQTARLARPSAPVVMPVRAMHSSTASASLSSFSAVRRSHGRMTTLAGGFGASLRLAPLSLTAPLSTRSMSSSAPSGGQSLDSVLANGAAAGAGEQPAASVAEVVAQSLSFSPDLSHEKWYHAFPEAVHSLLELLRDTTGLPWWATIIAATVILRTAIMPLMVKQARNLANMTLAKPEMQVLTDQQRALRAKYQVAGLSIPHDEQIRLTQQMRALQKKHNVNPLTSIAMPFAQIPIFLSMFAALRTMGYVDPAYYTEGLAWFQNLGQLDPGFNGMRLELGPLKLTMGLPLLNMGLIMTSVYCNSELSQQSSSPMGTMMKKMMYGFAVASLPLCSSGIPAGVLLYWCTSNVYAIFSGFLLRSSWGKRMFGIPELPKDHDALADMEKNWKSAREAWRKGMQEVQVQAGKQAQSSAKARNPFEELPPADAASTAAADATATVQQAQQPSGEAQPQAPFSPNPHAAQNFYRRKAAAAASKKK